MIRLLLLVLLVLAAPLVEAPPTAPIPVAPVEMAAPELPDHPSLVRRSRVRTAEAATRTPAPVMALAPLAPVRPAAAPAHRRSPAQPLLGPYSTALPPPAPS